MKPYFITALFLFSFAIIHPAFASETVIHNVNGDTEWNMSGSPYVIYQNDLTIPQGVTLTIDPGVVVKLAGSITVKGTLTAHGATSTPIVFTSIQDDSAGGDTNTDGTTTSPQNEDWRVIEAKDGGIVDMSYTTVKYGGLGGYYLSDFFDYWPMIGNSNGMLMLDHMTIGGTGAWSDVNSEGGTTTVTNSQIIMDDRYGVRASGGSIELHNNSFVGNGAGIVTANIPDAVVNAQNNWWGDASGPAVNGDSSIPNRAGILAFGETVNYQPWLTSDPFATSSSPIVPVIIIPGILGSADVEGVLTIDPILHVYDDFIATFEANGYVADKTIFPFPYDWRNSNINTAQLLRLKINQVKQICGCNKVDLVAHSMGGLVARQYVESSDYQNDVRDIVFIGTPHLGAPEDYLTWEGATHAGRVTDFKDELLFRMMEEQGEHAGYSTLYDYIHSRPISSLQELLPIYSYKADGISLKLEPYSSATYPINPFLENLDANKATLKTLNILNIVGDTGLTTIGEIVTKQASSSLLWQHGEPVNLVDPSPGLIDVEGDGTVSLSSSESLGSSTVLAFEHKELVDNSSSLAFKFLTNREGKKIVINSNDLNKRYVLVRLFSPIDSLMIAPDGKKIGKDPSTGQDVNQIPGAYYTGSNTDNEFIVIPDPLDGGYSIQTQGKGNGGSYTISTSYLSEATSTDTNVQGVTAPGFLQTINFQITATSSSPVVVTSPDLVTASSTEADIGKAFSLGWITKKNIENELLNKMDKVLKAQAKIDTVTSKVNGKNTEKKVTRIEMVMDKKLGAALLIDLTGYTKDKINLQGYTLIRDDIQYLIDH